MAPADIAFPIHYRSTKRPWPITAVPQRTTKKQRVLNYAAERNWTSIGEHEWNELRSALPDISAETIRTSGLAIDPPWCGIKQHTFEELAESLHEFTASYAAQPHLRDFCRKQVIEAKDQARLRSRTNTRKTEMVDWMLVWLSDPALFPAWHAALMRVPRNDLA